MQSRLLVPAALVPPLALLFALAEGRVPAVRPGQRPAREPMATIVVRNPLPYAREDVVAAWVPMNQGFLHVRGPDGRTTRLEPVWDETLRNAPRPDAPTTDLPLERVLFVAKLPARGIASYDVEQSGGLSERPAGTKPKPFTGPSARDPYAYTPVDNGFKGRRLENARLRVTIDEAGDIASIVDKASGRETLSAPVRLDRWGERPDRAAPERFVGPAELRGVENGPARAAIEIVRESDGSRLVQTVRLAGGAADSVVEVENRFDWKPSEVHPGGPFVGYRASFRLPMPQGRGVYGDEGGSSPDPNGGPRKDGSPFRGWIDLAGVDGGDGVGVFNPDGMAPDRSEDGALRLAFHPRQTDDGHGKRGRESVVRFDLVPHAGDWRKGKLPELYERLTRPIQAFTALPPR